MTALNMLYVFLGGGLGACLRWLLGLLCTTLFSAFNPGVTIANLSGCFFIGIAAAFFERHTSLPEGFKLFVITGFLGGFTTFSSFSLETLALLQKRPSYGFVYLAGKILLCLFATYEGYRLFASGGLGAK